MRIRAFTAAALACVVLAGLTAAADDSIYHLSGVFKDQTGTDVRLDVERGHPVLMSMFYASCTDTCPLLIAELHRIEVSLPPGLRGDVRIVLVSVDPQRDTPAALQKLVDRHRVDQARWRFLTGPDAAVREVAAVLGVRFRRLSTGVINHSSVIAVLDRDGAIDTRIEGITPGDPKLLARVTDALKALAVRRATK
jgi:protein SCO1/2